MILRAVVMSLLASCGSFLPARASQPEGYAAKLIANPPVSQPVVTPGGLPPVNCLGFSRYEPVHPRLLDPADTVTLEMAIVPFRSGRTEIDLSRDGLRLTFADGLVNGLPYNRFAWNDVRVRYRPATQDYMLTLNGVEAGPFPIEFPCQPSPCLTLDALIIRGVVLEETAAWIDSVSLIRESPDGQDRVFENAYDQCFEGENTRLGGLLIMTPPDRFIPGGGCAVGNR